ncbi:MAG: hypothetical protein ACFE8M_14230 [Candidatus Hermodarchaeota archaeon]
MFKEIFQFYKIGKELGLNKKEINKILIFDNTKHPTLYLVLLIIAIVATGVIAVILGIVISRDVYPQGALYSIVKRKDFKKRR